MADLSDSELFDAAISGEGDTPSPAPAAQQEPTQQPAQSRDEAGRFASQQEQPAPAAAQPAAEPAANAQDVPVSNNGGVPVGAVQAERGKRQEAEREAEALRREVAELRGMVTAQRQPAAQPQQQKDPASLWDEPETYLKDQFAQHLTPLQQQMFDQKAGFSRMLASDKHGADVVEAALQAALAAKDTPEGRILDEKLANAVHPFDEMVKWHKQSQAMSKVGGDPDAWLQAEIEKRLADPAFLATAVERARAGATAQPASRSAPVTSLPPSLSRLPAGGNAPADGDQSDGALFSSVTSGRRG